MYRRIYPLLGLSILFVVVSHGITNGLYALVAWTHRYASLLPVGYDPLKTPEWYVLITGKILLAFCLPAFYFISGYFASYARNKETGFISSKTIKARVMGLFIPYVIWVIFGLLMNYILGDIVSLKDGALFLLGFNSYPFIVNLIIFYLFSGIMMRSAKNHWKTEWAGLLLLQVLVLVIRFTIFTRIADATLRYILVEQFWPSVINYIPYFPMGIFFGLHSQEFTNVLKKNQYFIISGFVISLIVSLVVGSKTTIYVDDSTPIIQFITLFAYHGLSLFTILLYILCEKIRLPLTKQLTKLGSYALGIYLVHSYFITFTGKLIYHVAPSLLNYQIILAILSTGLGLFLPLGVMKLFKKLPIRSLYPYFFG